MLDQGAGFVLDTLKSYGPAGAVIAVLLYVVWALAKRLEAAQEARMKDREEHGRKLEAAQEARTKDWEEQGQIAKNDAVVLAQWSSTNEARNRTLEATARSQELAAAASSAVAANVASLSAEIRELNNKLTQLGTDVLRHRGNS